MEGIPIPEAITLTGTPYTGRYSLNAPDVVYQFQIRQEGLRDELGAQGVSGHQYGLCKRPLGGLIVWCTHRSSPLFLVFYYKRPSLLCKAEEEAQLTLGRDIIKIRGPCRRRGARLDRI